MKCNAYYLKLINKFYIMDFSEIPDKFIINSDSVNETNVTDYLIGFMWKCGNIDPFNKDPIIKEEKKAQLNILSKEKRKFSKIFPEIIKKFNRRSGRDNYTILNNFNNSSDFLNQQLQEPDPYYDYKIMDMERISDSFLYKGIFIKNLNKNYINYFSRDDWDNMAIMCGENPDDFKNKSQIHSKLHEKMKSIILNNDILYNLLKNSGCSAFTDYDELHILQND